METCVHDCIPETPGKALEHGADSESMDALINELQKHCQCWSTTENGLSELGRWLVPLAALLTPIAHKIKR